MKQNQKFVDYISQSQLQNGCVLHAGFNKFSFHKR